MSHTLEERLAIAAGGPSDLPRSEESSIKPCPREFHLPFFLLANGTRERERERESRNSQVWQSGCAIGAIGE